MGYEKYIINLRTSSSHSGHQVVIDGGKTLT